VAGRRGVRMLMRGGRQRSPQVEMVNEPARRVELNIVIHIRGPKRVWRRTRSLQRGGTGCWQVAVAKVWKWRPQRIVAQREARGTRTAKRGRHIVAANAVNGNGRGISGEACGKVHT